MTSQSRRDTEILLAALMLTLLVTSFPVKNVQYALPWIVSVYFALAGKTVALVRLIGLSLLVAAFSVVAAISSMPDVNVPGVFWGVMTYGTLLFWIARPSAEFWAIDTELLTRRGADLVAWFVLAQSCLGLVQFAYSRNPDAVTGTFDPTAFLTGVATIGQVSLAVCLIAGLLFLANFRHRFMHTVAMTVGALCLIVSQSGHQIIIAAAAVVAVVVVGSFSARTLIQTALLGSIAFAAVLVISPATVRRAPLWYERTVVREDSLKRQLWVDSIDAIAEPPAIVVGYGIGQYSSRAGLIASDDYLSVRLPARLTGTSDLYSSTVEPRLARFDLVGEGSAIAKPYSSVTSLLVEFGPLFTILLFFSMAIAATRQLIGTRRLSPREQRLKLTLAAGLVFMFGICLVENYVELVQAVFLPGFLFILGAVVNQASRATNRIVSA